MGKLTTGERIGNIVSKAILACLYVPLWLFLSPASDFINWCFGEYLEHEEFHFVKFSKFVEESGIITHIIGTVVAIAELWYGIKGLIALSFWLF